MGQQHEAGNLWTPSLLLSQQPSESVSSSRPEIVMWLALMCAADWPADWPVPGSMALRAMACVEVRRSCSGQAHRFQSLLRMCKTPASGRHCAEHVALPGHSEISVMTESSQGTGCSSLCRRGLCDWAGCSVARLEKKPFKKSKNHTPPLAPSSCRGFRNRRATALGTSHTCHSSRSRKA